jgi:hypothetical protein
MFELLLIVMGCYALAALLVHLAYWYGRGRQGVSKHYVWIADREQKNMEWYLRSLFSFSRWMGKDVQLTVVDRGDTEETMAVVERWSRGDDNVRVLRGKGESNQQAGKRSRSEAEADSSIHLLWMLQAEGIVSEAEHAVLVDLQNPADLSKMPF